MKTRQKTTLDEIVQLMILAFLNILEIAVFLAVICIVFATIILVGWALVSIAGLFF